MTAASLWAGITTDPMGEDVTIGLSYEIFIGGEMLAAFAERAFRLEISGSQVDAPRNHQQRGAVAGRLT